MVSILKKKRKSSPAKAATSVVATSPAEINVRVDAAPIAEQVRVLAGEIAQLGKALSEAMEYQRALLQQLAERELPIVNVAAPKSAKRATGYDVALVRDTEDNEILGFSLRPKHEN